MLAYLGYLDTCTLAYSLPWSTLICLNLLGLFQITIERLKCSNFLHVSKFSSKTAKVREESAFYKHLENTHEGKAENKTFADYFEVRILKAYKKPFTMCVEEGTYITSHKGELLNSKSEWHQAKLIRTTTRVVQGGADSLRQQAAGGRVEGGGGGVHDQPRGQGRTRGQ